MANGRGEAADAPFFEPPKGPPFTAHEEAESLLRWESAKRRQEQVGPSPRDMAGLGLLATALLGLGHVETSWRPADAPPAARPFGWDFEAGLTDDVAIRAAAARGDGGIAETGEVGAMPILTAVAGIEPILPLPRDGLALVLPVAAVAEAPAVPPGAVMPEPLAALPALAVVELPMTAPVVAETALPEADLAAVALHWTAPVEAAPEAMPVAAVEVAAPVRAAAGGTPEATAAARQEDAPGLAVAIGHDKAEAVPVVAAARAEDVAPGLALGHDKADATPAVVATAKVDDAPPGLALGHDKVDAKPVVVATAKVDDARPGLALGHDKADATPPGVAMAKADDASPALALGHDKAEATAAAVATAKADDASPGLALGHDKAQATPAAVAVAEPADASPGLAVGHGKADVAPSGPVVAAAEVVATDGVALSATAPATPAEPVIAAAALPDDGAALPGFAADPLSPGLMRVLSARYGQDDDLPPGLAAKLDVAATDDHAVVAVPQHGHHDTLLG